MCRGAGFLVAAMTVMIAAMPAAWGDGVQAGPAADGADAARYLFFSGVDLWRAGGAAHGGVLWSPDGINNEGFTLKTLLAGGTYRYTSGSTDIDGRMGLAAVMPGWRFKAGRFELMVYGGPELQFHRLLPDDPTSHLRGLHGGVRVGADLWYQFGDLAMVTLSGSGATIGATYWSRAAFGWRVFDSAWIGPEISTLGDETYHQFRFGAHVTGLRTSAFEWSVGAGLAEDSNNRTGAYGHLGFVVRR